MDEIVKHINDTNASYRDPSAGDAKNTDLFLDNDQHALFEGMGDQITVKYSKSNLAQAILFIASILPRKYDNSSIHKHVNYTRTFIEEQLDMLDGFFKIDGQPVETITQKWNVRINVPKKNGEIDNRFYFNGLLKDFEYLDENSTVRKSKFTIRNYLAGSYSDLHIKRDTDGTFNVWVTNATHPLDDGKEKGLEELTENTNSNASQSRQIIYYGAPGTGKSHAINTLTSTKSVIRTTFHPDSDYSTFVGAYKPTTEEQTRYNDSGVPVIYHDGDQKGEAIKDKVIVYDFVEQAFLKAYEEAWKKFFANPEAPEDEYLVIEEINRGNCAQIFGDLFQLLDRNKYGYSEYPITADNDISKHLKDVFAKAQLHLDDHSIINHMYNRGDGDVAQKVLDGNILLLPKNLYIWAPMNTSDQSLFPIDSAFKRRWDWKYMPIHNAEKNWRIAVNGLEYDWWQFLEKVNDYIGSTTNSEDKKLGYFFCKPKDGIITADTFVGKVIFYLWNDVFKDYGLDGDLFKDAEENTLTFDKFYAADAKAIREDNVNQFLTNLGLQPVDSSIAPEESEDISNESQSLKDKYLNFWLGFNGSYEQSGAFKEAFTNPKGLAQTWLNIRGLNRSYYVALVISGKNKVAAVQLYFSKGELEFEKYKEKYVKHPNEFKDRFEQDGVSEVSLKEATKAKYIQVQRAFDLEKDDWNTIYNWFHENALRFKELCEEIDPKE